MPAGVEGPARAAALDFARFLVEPETAARVRSDRAFPMLPVRGPLIGLGPPEPRAIPAVDLRSWSEAVSDTFLAPKVVPGLRIPGAVGYLDDLEAARVAAAGGEPVAEALGAAAESWSARTDRLGRNRQLWHYRQSLGAFTPENRPPPRPAGGAAIDSKVQRAIDNGSSGTRLRAEVSG